MCPLLRIGVEGDAIMNSTIRCPTAAHRLDHRTASVHLLVDACHDGLLLWCPISIASVEILFMERLVHLLITRIHLLEIFESPIFMRSGWANDILRQSPQIVIMHTDDVCSRLQRFC